MGKIPPLTWDCASATADYWYGGYGYGYAQEGLVRPAQGGDSGSSWDVFSNLPGTQGSYNAYKLNTNSAIAVVRELWGRWGQTLKHKLLSADWLEGQKGDSHQI